MVKRSNEVSDLDCWSIRDYRKAQPYHGRLSAPHPETPYLRNDHMKHKRVRRPGGVIDVPGRIVATLQRKFWDSNKVLYSFVELHSSILEFELRFMTKV